MNFDSPIYSMDKDKSTQSENNIISTLKQISYYSGGNFIAQIVMMIYAIVVAKTLGPNQLGIYSGLYAVLGTSISLVNFGYDIWILKETDQHNNLRELSGEVISLKLATGGLWSLLIFTLLYLTQSEIYTASLILMALGDTLSDRVLNTVIAAWNIDRNIKCINTALLSSRIFKFILLLGLIFINQASLDLIISSRFLVSLVVLLISFWVLKPIIKVPGLKKVLSSIKSSYEFGFSEILSVIYGNIDIVILSYFSTLGTGYYSPASGIVHALFIIPNSFYTYLLPKYAKMNFVDNKQQAKKTFNKIILSFSSIGLIMSLCVFLGGAFIVSTILGPRYNFTGRLLTILSPILLIKSISFGLALIIVISGQQKYRLLPQFLVSLLTITLCLIFIPISGVVGVALIYVVGEFLLMIYYWIIVRKFAYGHSKTCNLN